MIKILPPVGHPISLRTQNNPTQFFKDVAGIEHICLYGSGTMALAAGLIAARKYRNTNSIPEVLLPAYACPDLMSAIIYAGLKPVLIDFEKDRPWMDLDKIRKAVNPNTVAVLAVHFLGIPERLDEIASILKQTDILLIEDSAQLFPKDKNNNVWKGDVTVVSFGRGKPVSLLGGGAMFCKDSKLLKLLPETDMACAKTFSGMGPDLKYKVKVFIYNALFTPLGYGLAKKLPYLKLGQTVYKPLHEVVSMESGLINLLGPNISLYVDRSLEVQKTLCTTINNISGDKLVNLPYVLSTVQTIPLLRYPILLYDQEMRDKACLELNKQGIGATKMYARTMPSIPGLESYFSGDLIVMEADNFAGRLLTLPCHAGLTKRYIQKIRSVMADIIK